MVPLIEYRIVNYSTALKLYNEQVTAQVNRTGDGELVDRVASAFSEVYDRSFGYRLIYSMRNAFQHGVRGLLSLHMTARLADGSDKDRESEAHAHLKKDAFAGGRANAAVRQQVRDMDDDIDLFELGDEAFGEVQMLHARLAPMLHPGAPAAAQLINRYIKEIGGQRPHFHKYIRGLPAKGLLGTTTMDRGGFDYVARQGGTARSTPQGHRPMRWRFCLPTHRPLTRTRSRFALSQVTRRRNLLRRDQRPAPGPRLGRSPITDWGSTTGAVVRKRNGGYGTRRAFGRWAA